MRAVFPLLLLLSGCTVGAMEPQQRPPPPEPPDLATLFDCLRERRLALVSAHRGQADPSRAENALSSFDHSLKTGPLLIEIDIARTRDGALVLLHDDGLDRTTTGTGPVGARSYEEIRRLRLKTPNGDILDEPVPSLDEALIWARRNAAILQLDLKRGVALREVVDVVRRARMEKQVILIAYTRADSEAALRIAPEMMVSASGRTPADLAALIATRSPRLLWFTGLAEPAPALVARLDRAGIEAITATLGRPGERLDDRYLADGDGREYGELAARGVALIASDRPAEAWDALENADREGRICLEGPQS